MRVEQEQKVTEDARIFAEQDAAAQKYASHILQVSSVGQLSMSSYFYLMISVKIYAEQFLGSPNSSAERMLNESGLSFTYETTTAW
jgi:hypothetical protein